MRIILLYIWQLPQNIIGLLLIWLLKAEKRLDYGTVWYMYKRKGWFSRFLSGAAYGQYILLPDNGYDIASIRHEYGHCIQSELLGWFYILIVGLPSIYNNLRGRRLYKNMDYLEASKDYYSRYPEKQADSFGGVVWVNGERVC